MEEEYKKTVWNRGKRVGIDEEVWVVVGRSDERYKALKRTYFFLLFRVRCVCS